MERLILDAPYHVGAVGDMERNLLETWTLHSTPLYAQGYKHVSGGTRPTV